MSIFDVITKRRQAGKAEEFVGSFLVILLQSSNLAGPKACRQLFHQKIVKLSQICKICHLVFMQPITQKVISILFFSCPVLSRQ